MAGEKTNDDDLEMRRARGDFVDDDPPNDDPNDDDPNDGKKVGEDEPKDPPEDDAGKKGDDEDDDRKSRAVPYARFREVNEDSLRKDGEIAELRRQLANAGNRQPPPEEPKPVDIRALRKAARDAMLEGDTEKAAELDAQADEEISRRSRSEAVAEMEQRNAIRDLNAAANRMIQKYPFLDSQSEDADEEAIDLVIAARDANIRKGMALAEALEKAADKIGRLFSKEGGDGGGKKEDAGDPAGDRARQAITRNAAAANRQPPPPTGGRGERGRVTESGDKINVAAMSDEEFRALPEAEKARIRGDFV